MIERAKKGFAADFKRFFIRGLVTLLPTVLTIVLLVKCYEFIQDNISEHITRGVAYVTVYAAEDYPSISKEEIAGYLQEKGLPPEKAADAKVLREIRFIKLAHRWNHGPRAIVGFVLAIILIYIAGRLLGSYLGHKLWRFFEQLVQQIPGFKQIYPHIKQVTEYLFGEHKIPFSRVVAIPYPREGIYSLGFVTGTGFRSVAENAGQKFLTVFVPSVPTPFTGFVVYVKESEVIDLPVSIEEALRFMISGGVLIPDHQQFPEALKKIKEEMNNPAELHCEPSAAAVAAAIKV